MANRIKLPKHLRELNADVLQGAYTAAVGRKRSPAATADKRHVFGYWWHTLTVKNLDYFPETWEPREGVKFGRWEFDWAFERLQVAVEVDGGQHEQGGGRHATDSDRDKLNHAAAEGWLVLRFSPEMMDADPGRCCQLVEKALTSAEEHRNAWR